MIYAICVVRDQKSAAFGRPFFTTTKGTAIRGFDDEVNRAHEQNDMYNHPEDFGLFYLGTFNDADGSFDTGIPQHLIQADQVKKGQLHNNGISVV